MSSRVVQSPSEAGSALKPPIVRVVDLRRSFNGAAVLKDVSIDFPTGRTTVVLGPSGCGKSVLLKHIIGLLKPDSGEVWFGDTRVDRLSESQLAPVRKRFGFLFQHGALFDSMNVADNVEFPLREHSKSNARQRRQRTREVLEMVGLADAVGKMPAELSGGQQKRIALARAIVLEPSVILYDEPTTGLDPIRADVINDLIIKLQRELRVTSIVVTHDLGSAFKIADLLVMLYDGEVIASGTVDAIRASDDPIVTRFLAGDASAAADLGEGA